MSLTSNSNPLALALGKISNHLNIPEAHFQAKYIHSSTLVDVWKIEGYGLPLILRLQKTNKDFFYNESNMLEREAYVINLIAKHTDLPVPKIFLHEAISDSLTLTLMQCLPGIALDKNFQLTYKNSAPILIKIGKSLQKLHSIPSDTFGYTEAIDCKAPYKTWPDAFSSMWVCALKNLKDYQLIENTSIFEKAYSSYEKIFYEISSASLVHTDIWQGNILMDAMGNLTGFIDWDMALWADPAMDFVTLEQRQINNMPLQIGYGKDIHTQSFKKRLKFYFIHQSFRLIFHHAVRKNNYTLAKSLLDMCHNYLTDIENL